MRNLILIKVKWVFWDYIILIIPWSACLTDNIFTNNKTHKSFYLLKMDCNLGNLTMQIRKVRDYLNRRVCVLLFLSVTRGEADNDCTYHCSEICLVAVKNRFITLFFQWIFLFSSLLGLMHVSTSLNSNGVFYYISFGLRDFCVS